MYNIDFLSISREIGWEEHLQYDLFSVKWLLNMINQSVTNFLQTLLKFKLPVVGMSLRGYSI